MKDSDYQINEGEDGIVCIEPKNKKDCNTLDKYIKPLKSLKDK